MGNVRAFLFIDKNSAQIEHLSYQNQYMFQTQTLNTKKCSPRINNAFQSGEKRYMLRDVTNAYNIIPPSNVFTTVEPAVCGPRRQRPPVINDHVSAHGRFTYVN